MMGERQGRRVLIIVGRADCPDLVGALAKIPAHDPYAAGLPLSVAKMKLSVDLPIVRRAARLERWLPTRIAIAETRVRSPLRAPNMFCSRPAWLSAARRLHGLRDRGFARRSSEAATLYLRRR
jgi:hypothetical protein